MHRYYASRLLSPGFFEADIRAHAICHYLDLSFMYDTFIDFFEHILVLYIIYTYAHWYSHAMWYLLVSGRPPPQQTS